MVEKIKKRESKLELVKKLTQQLLTLLEVAVEFVVEEKEEIVNINFQTDNPGMLIGYHGETISAFQRILSLMVYKKLDEWPRILVDVGDYRQRRQQTLEKMALSVAQKVKFSGRHQALPPMSPVERRIIHIALSDNPDVETESEGEGRERRVVVKPQTA